MIREIFSPKRGKHDAPRRMSKKHTVTLAAAILTVILIGSASAAANTVRNTSTLSGAAVDSVRASAVARIIAAGARLTPGELSKAYLSSEQPEDGDEAASESTRNPGTPGKSQSTFQRTARVLKTIAMSRAVREELSERSTVAYANQMVTVFGPDRQFPGATRYEDGVTLVDAVAFAQFAGASVAWDGDTLRATGSGYDVSVTPDKEYVISSGRLFWTKRTISNSDGCVFVPIDALARAFGYETEKEDGEYSVHLTGGRAVTDTSVFYREDEVYWLSRIIQAESGCEPLSGKIAVGNVVLNRVRDERFPDTIYGVIFDRRFGIQFSPTANGTIYREPSEESVAAAKLCLEGYSVSDEITFFFNPSISKNTWISDNRAWVCTIGNHAFYS